MREPLLWGQGTFGSIGWGINPKGPEGITRGLEWQIFSEGFRGFSDTVFWTFVPPWVFSTGAGLPQGGPLSQGPGSSGG